MISPDFLMWSLMGLWWLAVLAVIVYGVLPATRLVNAVTRIADALERERGSGPAPSR